MADYSVEVEAGRLPTVSVDLYDLDHEPTEAEIQQALEDLSQQDGLEGYLAEWLVTEGGNWKVITTYTAAD